MQCFEACSCFPFLTHEARRKDDVEGELTKHIRTRNSVDLEAWLKKKSRLSPKLSEALKQASRTGNPNARTSSGNVPLHEAIKCHNVDVVQQLLRARAETTYKDGEGESAIDVCKKHYPAVLQTLLTQDAKWAAAQFTDLLSFIPTVPIFDTLPPDDYPLLAGAFKKRVYKEQETVITQGETGTEFFVIVSGQADVFIQSTPQDGETSLPSERVAKLGQGDFFGEASLLYGRQRNATIVATSVLEVQVLDKPHWDQLELRQKLRFRKRKAVKGAPDRNLTSVALASRQAISRLEDKSFVKEAMLRNENMASLLSGREDSSVDKIVDQFGLIKYSKGEPIVVQGEMTADFFYVLGSGTVEYIVDGQTVGTGTQGASFGELALLYRAPRAATVQATSAVEVWAVAAADLKPIFREPLKRKLADYAKLLRKVEIFANKTDDERAKLADALLERSYFEGEYILVQGEQGKTFFVLIDGRVEVEKDGSVVAKIEGVPGGTSPIFGERALQQDEPRAASVRVASEKARVLALDRAVFLSVLGDEEGSVVEGDDSPRMRRSFRFSLDSLKELGLLGCGAFGAVTLVKCQDNGQTYALKQLSKGFILEEGPKAIMNEKLILRSTSSPFLIRLAATFNSQDFLYFLLEPALGGELYTLYERQGLHGNQEMAKFYVACVVLGMEHLHERYVCYRDLKPENLLLSSSGYLKITDFGLSKFVMGYTYTTCGTPEYFAPELLATCGYNLSVDWWSVGILLFELMVGQTPFVADDPHVMFRKIKNGVKGPLSHQSGSWTLLVKGLCCLEPTERMPMRSGGIKNIENALFYAGFPWEDIRSRTMPPPYLPKVKSPEDLSNFGAQDEDRPPQVPYKDPGTNWDAGFDDPMGPSSFAHC
mmetsp:Transcript_58878/g.131692  ORF Transcript_58878/g.131692 Transcript_58878/m.131692 type:complete len:882 (-) Transcript_58878:72-2717(-)